MSDDIEHSNEETPPEQPGEVNLQDLLSGLNLTPTWAKPGGGGIKPHDRPEKFSDRRGDRDDRKRSRDRDDRGRERPRSGPPRSGTPRDGAPRGGPRRDGPRERRPGEGGPSRGGFQPREERVVLPVEVSFIPDRDRLGAVVHQLHAVKRAFPLLYLANLFLDKPEHHLIKIEGKPGHQGEPVQFFQDKESRMVFMSRDGLTDYLVRTHLDRHFERVEQQIEPPSGNFVCVGRCRRTGTVIGPPNYHGYNERVMELQRIHFPHMSLDEYRNSIEMVRDPAVVERWKEECRTQVRYRLRETPEAEANLTLAQAETLFNEKYAPGYVSAGSKVILPARLVDALPDVPLRQAILAARTREDRFPFSMLLAVRPAFRRMRLHLFKAGKDETFVTAIPPKPLDAQHAIAAIKDMIDLLANHPGWSRQKLIDKLYPGKSADDPEIVEKMGPLPWLVDKGHVIEFFNGTYAIPGHLRMAESVPTEKPAVHHHPDLNITPTATAATPPPPPDLPEPESPVDSPAGDAPSQC